MDQVMRRDVRNKKWFFPLLLWGATILLYQPIRTTHAVVDRVVAVVNQEVITLSEVEKIVLSFIVSKDRNNWSRSIEGP